MKKALGLLAIILLVVPVVAGCASAAPPNPQPEPVAYEPASIAGARNSEFDMSFFHQVALAEAGKNVVLSPLSLRLALAMTYNGASGETKRAMADVLGFTGLTDQQVNDRFSAMMKSLEGLGEGAEINIANSLWGNQEYQFYPEFIQACQASYDAEVANLNFGDPTSLETINNWVKEKTKGRIDKIVEQLDPMNDLLVLINALTFDGKWTESFDPALTQTRDFYLPGGSTTQAQMMTQEGHYNYYVNDRFQAVALPYGDGEVSMYVFLPKQSADYQTFLSTLTAADWDAAKFQSSEGSVQIPRFTLKYDRTLNDDLKAMGMGPAFEGGFDKMAQLPPGMDAFISEVRQKDYIEVNEEGTKAAAATSVKVGLTSAPANSFVFNADRPFFFTIVDNASGTPLFLGSVINP